MNLFISADIEGVTGVTRWEETEYGGKGYEAACRQMSLETAAVCEAALEAGHTVTVRDGHGDACNLDPELLPDGITLIRGWMASPQSMMAGLDEHFDGVLYVGYHAPAASNESPLAHTTNLSMLSSLKLNGRLASEFTFNSMLADSMGVPSLFLCGDAGICRMAREEYPGIAVTAVKSGIGGGTVNLHPKEALRRIRDTAAECLAHPCVCRSQPQTCTMEITYREHRAARKASWYPGAELLDAHTVRFCAEHFSDISIAYMFMTV